MQKVMGMRGRVWWEEEERGAMGGMRGRKGGRHSCERGCCCGALLPKAMGSGADT